MESENNFQENIEYGKVVEIEIGGLRLDKQNFRLDFGSIADSHERDERLFEEEDIIGMAEDIVSSNGLNPHENMLAIREDGKNIVLEGNRRLLAINCILNRNLVPARYRAEFDHVVQSPPSELVTQLKKVRVVFLRSRDEARPYIADKHSGLSTKQWSLISQWRFVKAEYDRLNNDLNATVNSLKIDRSKAINSLKSYNFLNYARGLNFWENDGLRSEISKNRLEPTRMTRALEYSDVAGALGLIYDTNFQVNHKSEFSKEKFDYVVYQFTKSTLTDTATYRIDTRSSREEIVTLIRNWADSYDRIHPQQTPTISSSGNAPSTGTTGVANPGPATPTTVTTGAPTVTPPSTTTRHLRPEKYFEKLRCSVPDQRLSRLTTELSEISKRGRVSAFPAAAIMLARALIESCLLYKIEEKNLTNSLKSGCYRGRCGLDDVISFSIANASQLFVNPATANPLRYLQGNGGHRNFMNDVVHGNFVDPTPAALEALAGDVREFLKAILSGNA